MLGQARGRRELYVEPTVDALTTMLDAALGGGRSPTNPVDRAWMFD
ncbi:hypothetical protein GJ633_00225 [Halorubrum sp. CBA1125]|nr:hypothetical protein [Halorubrum sp. CBA1125]MUW13245.1 hypothetical protein [Halorubrum sp. CBA1125]